MKICFTEPAFTVQKIAPLIFYQERNCKTSVYLNSPEAVENSLNYLRIVSKDGINANLVLIDSIKGHILTVSLGGVQIEGQESFSIVVPAQGFIKMLQTTSDVLWIYKEHSEIITMSNKDFTFNIQVRYLPPYDYSISSDHQPQLLSSYDELSKIYKKVCHLDRHLLLSCKNNNLEYFSAKDKEIIYGRIEKKHPNTKILINIDSLDTMLNIVSDLAIFSPELKEKAVLTITGSKKDNFKVTTFQCEWYQFQCWNELVAQDIETLQINTIESLSQFKGIYKTTEALEFINGLIVGNPDNKEVNLEFSSDNLSASICYPNQDKFRFPLQKVQGISILGESKLNITIDSQYLINGLNSISDEWFLMILNEFDGKKSMIIQSINFDSGQTYSNSQIEEIIETSKSDHFMGCRYVAQW